MKKIIGALFGVAFLLVAVPAFAAVPNWDVTGTHTIDFVLGGTFTHDAILTQVGGVVSGSGGYPVGGSYTFAWIITSGAVSGDDITLTMDYTVGAVGTTMHMSGTIAPDGSISGDWDDNFGGYREGTWTMPAGTAEPLDSDDDGVMNTEDKCPETSVPDVFPLYGDKKATNRWMMDEHYNWITNGKPGTQGGFDPTPADTYGCSGKQILDRMADATGLDFGGHYKFGVTKSIIEDWMAGVYHVGPTFVETVEVPGTSDAVVTTSFVTKTGTDYELTARGTYTFVDWTNAGIADASCSLRIPGSFNPSTEIAWIPGSDLVPGYANYLELLVDGATAGWGACNPTNNTYVKHFAGTGAPFAFRILDNAYGDNSGSLFVDVVEDLWVDLW